jgi:hypothetical protein
LASGTEGELDITGFPELAGDELVEFEELAACPRVFVETGDAALSAEEAAFVLAGIEPEEFAVEL